MPSRGRRKTCSPASSTLRLWWSASDSGNRAGAGGAASHSFAIVLHEAVQEAPAWARGREATQFVDRTGGWVMALLGRHEVLVILMPRPRS